MPRQLLLLVVTCLLVTSLPVTAQDEAGTFGYPTVQAALDALKARSDVTIFEKAGWTVVEDDAGGTLWSFTPATHPAHPSAVKRTLVREDGEVIIETKGLCQAAKPA